MRILLVASSWTETLGHAVRSIAIAERCLAAGHEVAFLAPASYHEWAPAGVTCYASAPKPDFISETQIFFGFHSYEDVMYVSGYSDDQPIIDTIEREREVIREFRPDVIWNDEQYTIGASAALEQVEVASLVTWPLHPDFNKQAEKELPQRNLVLRRLRNAWNRVLGRYGLPPVSHLGELLLDRCQLRIAPTSPLLEPELAGLPDAGVHYVGSIAPQGLFAEAPDWFAEWTEGEEPPLVYVYLSSLPIGINTKEAFEALYRGLAATGFRVIFALGKFNEVAGQLELPEHNERIRFERFVPGEVVMARAQLAIFPASHSMLMSALRHNVPCLLFPDMFERSYNAACAAAAGFATVGSEAELTPEAIERLAREAMARFREPESAARRADLRTDLQGRSGAQAIVTLMEQAAGRRELNV